MKRLSHAGVIAALVLTASATAVVTPATASAQGNPHIPSALSLLDTYTVPAGTSLLGTPFGGLSGIDRDPATGDYVALSDDRSENAPSRFYRLKLGITGDKFTPNALTAEQVTTLKDANGNAYARKAVDP